MYTELLREHFCLLARLSNSLFACLRLHIRIVIDGEVWSRDVLYAERTECLEHIPCFCSVAHFYLDRLRYFVANDLRITRDNGRTHHARTARVHVLVLWCDVVVHRLHILVVDTLILHTFDRCIRFISCCLLCISNGCG